MDVQKRVDELVSERQLTFLHPFDDPLLFVGYGSVGLEILRDVPDVDVVLVACGGGGLLAGVATALKCARATSDNHERPIRVIGVEPQGADKMYQSVRSGTAHRLQQITTFVNGLAPPYAGPNAFEHVRRYVDDVILVSDEQVKDAMRLLYDEQKLVAESAGSATVAALLHLPQLAPHVTGKNVVCVISGGNVSLSELTKVLL
jgi:threonine dehydratase